MKWILLVVTVFCLLTMNVSATPIDFTDPAFSSANLASSFSYTTPQGLTLTFDPDPDAATLWWDSEDGLGVRYSYENDEVEYPELLTLSFSKTVCLSKVFITDLFNEWGYLETGWYQLNGSGNKVQFTASPDQFIWSSNGELALSIGECVDFITFSAPGITNGQNHEFSVAGVDVTPTPEPATMLLLGSGLLGLAGFRKKFRK